MSMPAISHQKPWTVYEVRALIEASPTHWPRYEVIDGELLVTPAPRLAHQRALELLREHVKPYIARHALGELFAAPADLELGEDTVVQPDLFVVPAMAHRPQEWNDVTKLLLAIEVISPSSRHHDRFTKRLFFQRIAVPEYWLIDIDERTVERWRPGDERSDVLREHLTWRPAGAPEPLAIDLVRFFAEVLGQ